MPATRPEEVAGVESVDLSEKVALVTGSTDGIGREAAVSLARLGATVVVHGRDTAKATAVTEQIESAGGTAMAETADFANLESVRSLADRLREAFDRLDILVNNAGAHVPDGQLSAAGIEKTFHVNQLAPFVLTNELLDVAEAESGGRIVVVASDVHRRAEMDLESLDTVRSYDPLAAYSRSKLANVLFTYALDRRLESATANCLHPGFVPGSALWRNGNVAIRALMRLLGAMPAPIVNLVGKTPTVAAAEIVYLAASPAVTDVSGKYFDDMQPVRSASQTSDEAVQEALWKRCAQLAGRSD
ncbi:MAG: SDR family oxidoreductase [Halodesulfurarchaeum sp.]